MQKIILFLLLFITGCDTIKDVPAPVVFVANIPKTTVLSLASLYPTGKNFISKVVEPNKLYEIKMEINGKNIQLLADSDGDILNTEEVYGTNIALPNNISAYISDKYIGAAIDGIAKVYSDNIANGYEVQIIDKNEKKKLLFDLNGQIQPDKLKDKKSIINKILYSNYVLYLSENELPTEIKSFINSTFKDKFDLKLLFFQSGEILLQYLQIGNPAGINEKFEYLFDANKKPIIKYEYLAKNNQNYTSTNNQNNIETQAIEKLKTFPLLYGIKIDLFGIEKSTTYAYSNSKGQKYIVDFPSKNSKPNIVSIQPIEAKNIPTAINDYLKKFSNVEVIFSKIVYAPTEEIIEIPPKIDKYVIEITHGQVSNKASKILIFDEKFDLLK